mmetsp:Transcript_19521/g.63603  ORF Transcript_19521/g.63603 Transcript_19521/m.63603 type:complete len:207 (-) Transcript_19521:775-1395(-)
MGLVAGADVSRMKASHVLRSSASSEPLASDCVLTTDGADRCSRSSTRLSTPPPTAEAGTAEEPWGRRPVRSRSMARVALKSSALVVTAKAESKAAICSLSTSSCEMSSRRDSRGAACAAWREAALSNEAVHASSTSCDIPSKTVRGRQAYAWDSSMSPTRSVGYQRSPGGAAPPPVLASPAVAVRPSGPASAPTAVAVAEGWPVSG